MVVLVPRMEWVIHAIIEAGIKYFGACSNLTIGTCNLKKCRGFHFMHLCLLSTNGTFRIPRNSVDLFLRFVRKIGSFVSIFDQITIDLQSVIEKIFRDIPRQSSVNIQNPHWCFA